MEYQSLDHEVLELMALFMNLKPFLRVFKNFIHRIYVYPS